VNQAIPLNSNFLGLDLAGQGNFILAIIVGATMWVQQKMATPASADPKQQAQNRMMLWMMPMMFFFLSTTFPSGLALYWVVSNIISIVNDPTSINFSGDTSHIVLGNIDEKKGYLLLVSYHHNRIVNHRLFPVRESDVINYGESLRLSFQDDEHPADRSLLEEGGSSSFGWERGFTHIFGDLNFKACQFCI
jgi:hypothetical protein